MTNLNYTVAQINTSLGNGLAYGYRPTALTGTAIKAAHDAAVAAGGGIVVLDQHATYNMGTTGFTWAADKVGLEGNLAILDCQNMTANGQSAIKFTSTLGYYMMPMSIGNFEIIGNTSSGRDFNVVALEFDTATSVSDVRTFLHTVSVHHFITGISIGRQSFLARFLNCEIFQCKFGILQQNVTTVYTLENVNFDMCTVFNNDCHLKSLIGQQIHFSQTSFDFFGGRQTADDACFDLRAGTILELQNCHVEFDYGKNAGDTLCPIRLTGANTKFAMCNGSIYASGASNNPAWTHLVQTDNQTQSIIFDDVQASGLGRLSSTTTDDSLIRGADINGLSAAGTSAKAYVRWNAEGIGVNDVPACIGYQCAVTNPFRNGIDDPYAELGWRTSVTGTAAISTATAENGITPRNGATNMFKITGAGRVCINLPNLGLGRVHAWSFFQNGGAAVGTIVVRERLSGLFQKFDGTTVTNGIDPRASYAGTTVSITGGVNSWVRCSWKNINGQVVGNSRRIGQNWFIEIDTTSMSSGAFYIGCFTMDLI